MHIKIFTFNGFQENTYILYDDSKSCIIIDPGNSNPHEDKSIDNFLKDNELKPIGVYNTHCHIDHIYGNCFIIEQYEIPLMIPKGEEIILKSTPMVANMYAMPSPEIPKKYEFYDENRSIEFGNTNLEVLNVPGHSPDHMVFYNEEHKILIAGDTLFRDSIGRTDLPGGNHNLLLTKITEELYTLPDETVVYPGHGPSTKIGYEKRNNPFIRASL